MAQVTPMSARGRQRAAPLSKADAALVERYRRWLCKRYGVTDPTTTFTSRSWATGAARKVNHRVDFARRVARCAATALSVITAEDLDADPWFLGLRPLTRENYRVQFEDWWAFRADVPAKATPVVVPIRGDLGESVSSHEREAKNIAGKAAGVSPMGESSERDARDVEPDVTEPEPPGLSFDAVFERFERWQRQRNFSQKTLKNRRACFRTLAATCDPMTAGRDEIERWLDSCDLIPDSRKHYVHVLSGFYRWAVEEGMITSNPTARVATARRKRRLPRPIPPSQLEPAVAAATDPRMRAWLLLGCLAGLRCCEIAGLGGEDIGEHSIFVANGKGGHQREIPLHPRLRDALDAFGAPERGVVFPIKDTWPRPETVSSYISNHLRKFGVEKGPHRLRHSFGSSLYQTTKDIRLTQELMGHNSIETTMLYTQVDAADADAVDAVRALNLGGGR